ncbi:long-chain fatty acid--CoA ligase [Mycolicibacterium moriokaense]|nr:long-chain fatty acid--CoA ligase [Mycolicibacterium moriokaense]
MSILTREILASADSSPRGLTAGTVADPIRSSWREVHDQARRMAAGLAAAGVGPHGSVAVLATDAADVAPLAQAIWLRAAALTMLQQPTPRTDLAVWLHDTMRAIATIRADLVVVGGPFLTAREHLGADGTAVCTVESLRDASLTGAYHTAEADETDIAMRQLTSGSTGVPKAVEISHANLAANAVAIRHALELDTDTDVMASWLPLSHDMGMIGFVQFPMQAGVETVAVAAEEFLRRPIAWAELISKHRATITSGPNFAYAVLARALQKADPATIDLSSLRIAVNGAEPVDHRSLATFATAGARFGLSPGVPTVAYGLAEATLIVSMGAPQEPAIVDSVSRRTVTLAQRAQPVRDDSQDVQHVVCVGSAVTGMDVRIVRDAAALGPREIGVIELRGAAVSSSYLTSDGVFPLAGKDGWVDTGDLGYLDEHGRIYVCGRAKDLIVVAGSNLYPHDIERAAESVDGVRKGCVIALRVDGEREGFAVLAEAHDDDREDTRLRITRDIIARVNSRVGYAPREVRLFPAGTLPKTASGKLRRSDARELLAK